MFHTFTRVITAITSVRPTRWAQSIQVHNAGKKYASSNHASASKLSYVEIRVEGYCLPIAAITP